MRRGDVRRLLSWSALGLVIAASADAQTTEPDSWQFAVTAYGYLPAISGTATL